MCNADHNKPQEILPHIFNKSETNVTEEKVLKDIKMSLSNLEILRGLFHNFNENIKEIDKRSRLRPGRPEIVYVLIWLLEVFTWLILLLE
jgi:hypothetical protein